MFKRIVLFVIVAIHLVLNLNSFQNFENNSGKTGKNEIDKEKITHVLSYFDIFSTHTPFEIIDLNEKLEQKYELPKKIYGEYTKCIVENYITNEQYEWFDKKIAEGIYNDSGYLVEVYDFKPFLIFLEKKVIYSSYQYDNMGEIYKAVFYEPNGIIIDSYLKDTLTNEIERNCFDREEGKKWQFYKYDKRGKLLKQTEYIDYCALTREKLFFYDYLGNECELKYLVDIDTISCKFDNLYDDNKNLIKFVGNSFYGENSNTLSFKYDGNGKKIRELEYYPFITGITLIKADTFIYNEIGKLIEYGPRKHSNERTLFRYDSLGNKIYEANKFIEFTWKFDSNNNLIEKITNCNHYHRIDLKQYKYDNFNNIIEIKNSYKYDSDSEDFITTNKTVFKYSNK